MIVQAAAILHRRGDPDCGETEVADVIEPLDQALEVAAPVRVFRLAGRAVELDAVAAEETDTGIAFVKAGGQQKINGLLAKIAQRSGRVERRVGAGRGGLAGRRGMPRGGGAGFGRRPVVVPLAVGVKAAVLAPQVAGLTTVVVVEHQVRGLDAGEPVNEPAVRFPRHRRAGPERGLRGWPGVPVVNVDGVGPVGGFVKMDN